VHDLRNDPRESTPLSDVVRQAGQMMGTIPPDDPAAREKYHQDIIAKMRHRAQAAEAALQEQRGRAEVTEETPTWTARFVPAPLDATQYDLPSPAALHPLTDIESLRAELATLRSLLDAALPRLDWLEARERTHAAAIEHTADVVQAELLRSGGGVA